MALGLVLAVCAVSVVVGSIALPVSGRTRTAYLARTSATLSDSACRSRGRWEPAVRREEGLPGLSTPSSA